MGATLIRVWPLFFGLGLFALALAVQGSLLGVRAAVEGFDTGLTGLVMSGYFMGFLVGSQVAPRLIQRVGHVRTFGALTALASVTVLMHALVIDPWLWLLMRLLTGFAAVGVYIVVESWLNQAADNATRGQLLSVYMIVMLLGSAIGQFLLNMAEPTSFELFSLISVLISVAAIPILVTVTSAPTFDTPAKVSIRELFQWAPSGVVGSFLVNICYAMVFGMGAVYAAQRGMAMEEVALFMACLIIGGMLMQWPLGKISDRMDRRLVIAFAALSATACAVVAAEWAAQLSGWRFLLLAGGFGGFCFPLYALYLALTNDDLDPDRAVGVSSTMLLVGGAGATSGPFMVSLIMEQWGPHGFFWSLALICALMGGYAIYRHLRYPQGKDVERVAFQMQAPSPVGAVLQEEVLQEELQEESSGSAEQKTEDAQSDPEITLRSSSGTG